MGTVQAQDPVVQNILDELEIDSMLKYVGDISGENPILIDGNLETIVSRHKLNDGNDKAATYLHEKLESFGLQPEYETWSSTLTNVLAVQPGMLYPDRKVIVCGHFDAMPGGNADAPAADDDGSGVAAVLEAARVMSQYQFEHTIVYALWDEEEQGLVGSGFYAGASASNDDTIVAAINMDAIAYDGDGDGLARIHVRPVANSIAIGDTAFAMNARYNLDLALNINNPGASYSDHASFWNEGFSSILIIEDFDNDGNPHYHTPTDLIEFFDVPYYEKVAKLGIATTATLAVPYDGANAVAERLEEKPLRVWPNPFNDLVRVALPEGEVRSVELMDALGRVIENVDFKIYNSTLLINGARLKSGLYSFSIVLNNGSLASGRLIKQ